MEDCGGDPANGTARACWKGGPCGAPGRTKEVKGRHLAAMGTAALLMALGTLAAYAAAGGLDRQFGRRGIVITAAGAGDSLANAVVAQADGKIVVGGEAEEQDRPGSDFALARYLANGALDPSFGGDG